MFNIFGGDFFKKKVGSKVTANNTKNEQYSLEDVKGLFYVLLKVSKILALNINKRKSNVLIINKKSRYYY